MTGKVMTVEIMQAVNNTGDWSPTSRLAAMSTRALRVLRQELRDKHDAHRATRAHISGLRVRFGGRVDPELREYYKQVEFELLLRKPPQVERHGTGIVTKPRYESRRPTTVLKRAVDSNASQGTVSLGDLQAEYARLRR